LQPPAVEVADSEGATSSENDKDIGDEEEEGDEDSESDAEEEWYEGGAEDFERDWIEREAEYEREWCERGAEYEKKENDGSEPEHEDDGQLSKLIDCNYETPEAQASAIPPALTADSVTTSLPAMPLDLPMGVDAHNGNSESNPHPASSLELEEGEYSLAVTR
jgi:hypothetical protein